MRTAVVILNWNTKEYLERFLPGLLASATDGTDIIVADSASTDGSMEMLSEKFPTVRQSTKALILPKSTNFRNHRVS